MVARSHLLWVSLLIGVIWCWLLDMLRSTVGSHLALDGGLWGLLAVRLEHIKLCSLGGERRMWWVWHWWEERIMRGEKGEIQAEKRRGIRNQSREGRGWQRKGWTWICLKKKINKLRTSSAQRLDALMRQRQSWKHKTDQTQIGMP